MSAQDSESVQQAIRDLIQAYRDVRSMARKHEATLSRALERLERGTDVPSNIDAIPPDQPRRESVEALDRLEQARHALRLAAMADCLGAGMSIGEFARRWGFSRQLAARYARELRGEPAVATEADRDPLAPGSRRAITL